VATHRPPSLFGGSRREPVKSPRARDAKGAVLPPLESRRESASKRGYGHRWAKTRKRVLAQNPLCASCQKKGLLIPATLVDHIEPVHGPTDPKFYCLSNLQPLCRACHAQKTWGDTRAGKNRQAVPASNLASRSLAARPTALAAAKAAAPTPPAINLYYA